MPNPNGYKALFFDEVTSAYLRESEKNPLEATIKDMHITFKFGQLDEFPDELMQQEVEVTLIGYGCDGKNSGFQVELSPEISKYYQGNKPVHITVSIGTVNGEKGKPVDTAKLHFEPLNQPIKIVGKFGYFVFGEGKVFMDNSIFHND